jgi:hypothetical protein
MGEFTGVVLGEIESPDPHAYRYLFALVREGEGDPIFYLSAEENRGESEGAYCLRVVMERLEQRAACSDQWRDLDRFCDEAVRVAQQALGLGDEMAHRLM